MCPRKAVGYDRSWICEFWTVHFTSWTHFQVRPSPRLVCSDRPEGRVLSCLDPPATQAIPAFRVRGSGISVQGPALRAVPVTPRLHQSRGGGPCSPERTGCAHPQLPRWLAHTCTVSQTVVHTQGPGAQAPQPVGPSGQLGKEQTRANAEDLFSRHGVEFGQPDSTPHPGMCSVGAELPQDFIRQDGGPTETLSEAPGAYGCSCGDSSARSAPYETASALAPWPNPEVGVETRYSPGSDYTGLPQNLQSVVRSLVPSGRSAPGAGIQACCGIHGCLGHRLGSHVQRVCSVRGMDGSPIVLAYQLPRAADSTPGLEPPQSLQGKDDPIEGRSVGKHDLVVRFLRGGRRLNPPRPPSLPSWDLALVLKALQTAPLSLCSQSSWSFSLWKPYSWLRWPRSRGWGTCRHFRSTNRALSLGRLTPVQHWDPGPAMCPRFLPLPSGTRWWTCKRCPWRRQTQP